MKTALLPTISGVLCVATAALAQTGDADRPRLDFEPTAGVPPSPNRFAVSYRLGFNLHADFKNLGGFAPANGPGPADRLNDHSYDDGFNRVDISTNAGGLTWNWGYSRTNQ